MTTAYRTQRSSFAASWQRSAWCALAAMLALALASSEARAESAIADCGARQPAPFARAWTGFKGGCPTALGLSAYPGANDSALQWRSSLSYDPIFPGQIAAPPVIGPNGNVYVGTNEGYFYAVSRLGSRLWQTYLWGRIRAAATIGADGTIYAVSDYGALWAMDPSTGAIKWVHTGDLFENLYASPTIGPDGTIFYADYDGWVYAVKPDGTRKWAYNMLGRVAASPVLSRDGATLYIGDEFYKFRALNAQTGALRWITPVLTGDTATAAVAASGNIYVATSRGFVHALSATTGNPIWTYPLPFFAPVHSSPAIAPNGDVIVADVYGVVYAIRSTGSLRWSRPLNGRISSSPAIDSAGTIYIGTGGNFHFTWGIIGTILPGVNGLHALNGSTGVPRWQYPTLGGVASSPAISAVGSIYVGDDLGYMYMVGTQLNGQNARPTWPEDQVLRTPNTLPPAVVVVKPPACGDPDTRFTFGKTSVPGIPDVIRNVTLVKPECGGQLCGLKTEPAASDYGQAQLPAANQPGLLSAPSDVLPNTNTAMPAGTTLGCDPIAAPATCPIDPASINFTVACTLDADCGTAGLPADFRCASVCLNATNNAVNSDTMTPCSNMQMRCGRPFASGALACAANALPAVTTTTVPNPAALPARDAAYQNYRCHEVRECADEGALLPPWTAQCVGPTGATAPCTQSQSSLQPPATVAGVPPSFSQSDFFNRADFLHSKCELNQAGATTAGKTARLGGSKNSASASTRPNNWGVGFDPTFRANIAPKVLPFGRFEPGTELAASWRADGVAFGRSIPIFNVGGSADLRSLCNMSVTTSAQLFGQSVSVIVRNDVGVIDSGFNTAAGRVACEDALALTAKRLAEIKSTMVEAQQLYKNVVVDRVKFTKEICRAAMPPAALGDPNVCDSALYNPPSPSIAASVVNAVVGRYNSRHNLITQYLNEEKTSIANALAGVGLSDGGKKGYIKLIDLSQRFAVRVVDTRIPIGPVTLVLAIEGGGDWGLPGGLDYGVQFYESNGKMPGVFATADLSPAAGMNVDLYLGAGVSILGVAGADVGIGGTVRLVDVRTPILVTANLGRSTANPSGVSDPRTLLSDWGGSLTFPVKSRMPMYQWTAKTSMLSKAQLTLLSGEVDVRARVYFAFFSKTWKKRIAKLKGFTQNFTIVEGSAGSDLPLVDLGNPLDARPQVVFVNVPTTTTANFPGFNAWPTPSALSTAPENLLRDLVANECYPEVL